MVEVLYSLLVLVHRVAVLLTVQVVRPVTQALVVQRSRAGGRQHDLLAVAQAAYSTTRDELGTGCLEQEEVN